MLRRRANIEVHNNTRYRWEALNAAFSSGTSESVLPIDVAKNAVVRYAGVQRSFSIFTGTAGVFTYSILDDGNHWKTLAVMWDVPFDYNIWKSNYWNAEVKQNTNVRATRDLFWQMRNRSGNPTRGEDQWRELASHNFIIKGFMSSNSKSELTIIVSDRDN